MAEHNDFGFWGEEKAAQYLEQKGFKIMRRNWKCGHRDIDIVALDNDEVVIVEVKTRREDCIIEPERAVDRKKIKSLTFAANTFVNKERISRPLRFDIVAVTKLDNGECTINHIENAFLPMAF
ncbi:MAG: YraN family protein [Prevotella sp.]